MFRNCLALTLVVIAVSFLVGCGGGLTASNNAVEPGQLVLSLTPTNFGNVTVGTSSAENGTLTAGSSAITISSGSATGNGFSLSGITFPVTIPAGQSVPFTVTFTAPATGAVSGGVTFVSNATNSPSTVALTGTGTAPAGGGSSGPGQLALSLLPSNFGSVAVGSSIAKTGKLTASTSAVTISSGSWNGGFAVSGITFPVTVGAGQSISFTVTFTPQVSGTNSGTLSFLSDASNSPTTLALTGTGTAPAGGGGTPAGQLSLALAPTNFGSVTVGSSVTKTGTLTAGSSAITISSGSGTGGFSITSPSFPTTVAAGRSIAFTAKFAPAAAGAASGNISFVSNATNSPATIAVTGTGTTAPPVTHSVSLSWSASPSQVVGYNVYRGVTPGGPYPSKLTSSPQAGTTMVDNTVVGGTTYYYVATSVDSNSVESVYSDQITAVIP